MKKWHEKYIIKKEIQEGDSVLLLNFLLQLFPRKLKFRCSNPFKVIQVYPHKAAEVWSENKTIFKVN